VKNGDHHGFSRIQQQVSVPAAPQKPASTTTRSAHERNFVGHPTIATSSSSQHPPSLSLTWKKKFQKKTL
jgi:hypothetical protein